MRSLAVLAAGVSPSGNPAAGTGHRLPVLTPAGCEATGGHVLGCICCGTRLPT